VIVSRISPVDRETTNDRLRKTFDAIQKQLGVVPNMMRTMAHSPAVLDAYLAFGGALHRAAFCQPRCRNKSHSLSPK
jgi:hypothetical protein